MGRSVRGARQRSCPPFPGFRRVPLPTAAMQREAWPPVRSAPWSAIRSIHLPLLCYTCVLVLQVSQEAVNNTCRALVVAKGLADDAASQRGGKSAHL